MVRQLLSVGLGLLVGGGSFLPGAQSAELRVLDAARYHLGTDGFPEWAEFAGKKPHGRSLEIRFAGRKNATEETLFLRQRDVKQGWPVLLNGKRLGNLVNQEAEMICTIAVPVGAMIEGENVLAIMPPTAVDDIVVGEFRLQAEPLKSALAQATIEVRVQEKGTSRGLPCRITLVEEHGALAALQSSALNAAPLATRPGVAYTRDGMARLEVLPGRYTVYASRGFEYGIATQTVTVAAGQVQPVPLSLAREVPTPGWVAADTHIHTFTFSKHGDATLDERMLTIAGEGIELAVATDHNHHTDYSAAAARLRVSEHFTSVIGNEVTTRNGHFNAFPIQAGAAVPDFASTNWTTLLRGIRATPGVKVITLNHPRDLHSGFVPLGPTNFNSVSGASLTGREFAFDALEVVTSSAMQSDIMLLFHDWFALLNHGHRITAIGSSDTHDVSRFILGQGRTYVQCPDDNVAALPVETACQNLREGRATISLGLWVSATVNERHDAGDLAMWGNRGVTVAASVLGPAWAQADRVELFANGLKIAEQKIAFTTAVSKARVIWRLPGFAHDVHLVVLASGPGVMAPFWETPRPYQPSSKEFHPRLIAATNPVWVDADGDGKFTAAREYARRLVARHGRDPPALIHALAGFDQAVASQAASLWQEEGRDLRSLQVMRALRGGSPAVQRGFSAFASTSRK